MTQNLSPVQLELIHELEVITGEKYWVGEIENFPNPNRIIRTGNIATLTSNQVDNLINSPKKFTRQGGKEGYGCISESRVNNSLKNRVSLENTRDRLRAKLALKQ